MGRSLFVSSGAAVSVPLAQGCSLKSVYAVMVNDAEVACEL